MVEPEVLWDQLGKRTEAFKMVGELLPVTPRIVETGSIRKVGNWLGDGQSTIVWNHYAAQTGGVVITIDVDPVGAHLVDLLGLSHTTSVTADSVSTLRDMTGAVDFLYLDAYDIDFNQPEPAQKHHLQEISAAWHLLRKGSLVAVDDNLDHAGKGKLVAEFLQAHNAVELLNSYVRLWRI
jgi:predicted O-methyltransferase YrrM